MPCSTIMSSLQSQSQSLVLSNCTVFPDRNSIIGDLKLSASDLPMLSCHYIQKGCLFARPPLPIHSLISLLKNSLSRTLTHFSPLAGRLSTDSQGHVYVTCNDSGVHFLHANASHIHIRHILSSTDVPDSVKDLFAFDRTVSYEGHFNPILAVQVTELADGVFIGCSVNHAVTDGTSFWNFFNTFAEVYRGRSKADFEAPGLPPRLCPDFSGCPRIPRRRSQSHLLTRRAIARENFQFQQRFDSQTQSQSQ
ncbi:putative acetyltransferase [Camellia lanceoleosa]|uniref:Acetyltransferase n=1 Tax=Camellia lanceoleosa TaxID=1840588 RepID=A0ACC0GZD9_9ERIC|nr:putative acetyltransferase [Camellia lanceoleosa]